MALRNPDWGNKWITKTNTIAHRNISGQPRYKQRLAELIVEGFEITISLVNRPDLNTFITAYLANAGKQVTYIDFEGTVWTGFWNPEMNISRGRKTPGSGCTEEFRISLKFEGTHA